MKGFLKYVKINETNVSMILGLAVLILLVVFFTNYFRATNKASREKISATNTEILPISPAPNLVQYEVKPSDSLWLIAQKTYQDGFMWTQLWNSNLAVIGDNPGIIFAGTVLQIPPDLTSVIEYETKPGDSLWEISRKFCQNEYLWPQIAAENHILRPNLIYPGQKLKIDCK